MAVGVPVIGTHHGGIPELIQDGVTGFLIPERNSETLADRIAWLADHPPAAHAMAQAARQFVVQRYDTNRLNDLLVVRFEQLLRNNCLDVPEPNVRGQHAIRVPCQQA
jgi:colanic acid/amylovoran biosynthesis glycosyltransferase